MLCGCALCLARSLPKPPDILWDQHKGSFWEDEIQAAGAEASAPGPYCTWRKNGPKPVEQELLEGEGCGHGPRDKEFELSRYVCDDVNNNDEETNIGSEDYNSEKNVSQNYEIFCKTTTSKCSRKLRSLPLLYAAQRYIYLSWCSQ